MASKGEKFVIVKYALDHPNCSFAEWIRFSRTQPNLRVRTNDVTGLIELSLHEGQWATVHEFTKSYKDMVLTRLDDEWSRAIELFTQNDLINHLHLAPQPVQAERVVYNQRMVNQTDSHTREDIRRQIHLDALSMTSQGKTSSKVDQAKLEKERAKAELKAKMARHNW